MTKPEMRSRRQGQWDKDEFLMGMLNKPYDPSIVRGISSSQIQLIRGSQIKLEPVTWVWDGWLASGKMHILAGVQGTGKTTIALALAATITSGGCWPDGTLATKCNVVVWSGEDDPGDTLAPRLVTMGADMERVFFIGGVRDGETKRSFDPAKDLEGLKLELSKIDGGITLIIVDPIVSAVTGDSHKNTETRRGLQPLVDLAASVPCALLGITHFAKNTSGREPVDRVIGSVAFGAMARVVMIAAKAQSNEEGVPPDRLFLRAKSNIGPDTGGFKYDLRQAELESHPGIVTSSVLWGETVQGNTREILAEVEMVDSGDSGALGDAKAFLQDNLSDGPVAAKTIMGEAKDAGISLATLRRAKNGLGIGSNKISKEEGWEWSLPRRCSKKPEDAHQNIMSTFEKNEHLRETEVPFLPTLSTESNPKTIDPPIGPRAQVIAPDEFIHNNKAEIKKGRQDHIERTLHKIEGEKSE